MILAGHETTATALFWALYLLALDPETQEEVASETRGEHLDTMADIDRQKFTRAVIDETMRLYPPAFLVARAARDKGVPLIFVTGSAPEDAKGLAVGLLSKPYSQRDLLAAIEGVDAKLSGKPVKKLPRSFTLFAT